jgi:predicted ATP-dependent serine protease
MNQLSECLTFVRFPLKPNSKEPKVEGWNTRAPDDLMRGFVEGDNIGLRIEPPLFVVDVDDRRLAALIEEDIPKTLTVVTRRGYHYYFVASNTYPETNKKSRLLQLLAKGCYVVEPPSKVEGHEYHYLDPNTPIAALDGKAIEELERMLRALGKYENLIRGFAAVWTEGHRHNLSLWLNGALRKAGLERSEAEVVVKSICLLADDGELRDRLEALKTTYEKDIKEIAGWSRLETELQAIVGVDRARELLSLLPRPKENEGHAVQDFEIKPLSQLVSEAKPIEWIVENLIPRHGLVILAGKAGVGKSMVTLHLSHAVVNGEPLFGAFPIQNRGGVLIIDNENYPGLYLQRVRALGLNPLEGIDTLNLTDFSIDSTSSIKWLEKVIAEKKYALVVLDSWTNLIRNTDENKAPEVGKVLSRLRKIAYEHGCCFVLIHHLRKNMPYAVDPKDELRGSSTLMNEADLVIAMRESGKDGLRVLWTIKQRYGKEVAVGLRFVENDGRLVLQGREITLAEAESKVEKAIRDIEEYLADKPNAVSRQELIKNLPYSESTIKRALSFAVSMGKVVHIRRGFYNLPAKLGLEQLG